MKSAFQTQTRKVLALVCGAGLAISVLAVRAQADQWDKRTILTVDQPIQVTDRVLQPGTYVFKLAESNSDRHIVQIFNHDQSQIVDTILAIPNYRLEPTGDSRFRFWETPPGTAKALRAWFYPGDNFGQEFRYPKHLAMLEVSAPMAAMMTPVAPAPEPVQAEPAPEPAAPEAMTQEQPAQEQPVEMAQNNPPPAPETPAAQEEPKPSTLPKTASFYPLVGFGGVFALGFYALLRLRRVA